jgi:hypothetical protein
MNTSLFRNSDKIQLNIGAVSLNTIKAVIESSSEIDSFDFSLIASRRQIESAKLGCGYVNNFSTEDFAKYVRNYPGLIHSLKLARDHGGPFQRSDESTLRLPEALMMAKRSYEVDISSGFNRIHIEPEKAVSNDQIKSLEKFIDITKQLVGYCLEIKKKYSIDKLDFEIGTDEGIAKQFTLKDWDLFAATLISYFEENNEAPPSTISIPLGTKVINNSNLANYYSNTELAQLQEKINATLNLANKYGLQLKLHNADFLSKEMLNFYLSNGVININIAPELGVFESSLIVKILRDHHLEHLAQKFIGLAYTSNNWAKWINDHKKFSEYECGIAAGHYIFSSPNFMSLKQEMQETGQVNDLDAMLVGEIKSHIKNYIPINEKK